MTDKKKRPPYGFVFLDEASTESLQRASRLAQDYLKKRNFRRVMPAGIDFPETFTGFGASDSFQLRDRLGDDLALRSDVTVQVIKGFATQLEQVDALKEPRRYYYTVPVFRDIRKNYPTLREIYQTGAECIGAPEDEIIPELLNIGYGILKDEFHLDPIIVLGDIRLIHSLNHLFSEKQEVFRHAVYDRDVPTLSRLLEDKGAGKFADELAYLFLFFEPSAWDEKIAFMQKEESFADPLQRLFLEFEKAIKRLEALLANPRLENIPIQMEPLLLRKTDYYTGFIFEAYVGGLSHPPLRGGSYDGLLRQYSQMDYPASGFALDVSSLVPLFVDGSSAPLGSLA